MQSDEKSLPNLTAAQWDAIIRTVDEIREDETDASRQRYADLREIVECHRKHIARMKTILAQFEEGNFLEAELRRFLSPTEIASLFRT